MYSRFKGKLCLHLRSKELTIFRESFIWQLTVWAWAWAGARAVISIGYMSSRFKSKLCMVLSHSPQPFDQQALTVRLHFESWVLKNTRQHLFNSSKGWPLNIQFDPSPSGHGAHHFSLCHIWQLAAWALGVGWGSGPLGAATRCLAVVGRFIFFRD